MNQNEIDNSKKPVFPLFVYYVVNGVVDDMYQVDNDGDALYCGLEDFDTETDGYVIDSEGRFIRLRVKIWESSKAIVELENISNESSKITEYDEENNTVDFINLKNNQNLNTEEALIKELYKNQMYSKISDVMSKVIFTLLLLITLVSIMFALRSSNYSILIFIFGIDFIIFIVTISLNKDNCYNARFIDSDVELYNANKVVKVVVNNIQEIDFRFCNLILRVDDINLYFFMGLMYDRDMMKELLSKSNAKKGLGLKFCMLIDRCNEAMARDMDESEDKPQ